MHTEFWFGNLANVQFDYRKTDGILLKNNELGHTLECGCYAFFKHRHNFNLYSHDTVFPRQFGVVS